MKKHTPKDPGHLTPLPHDCGKRGKEFLPGPHKKRPTGKSSWVEKLDLPK